MDISSEKRRLFFGFEVHAPWPVYFPKGRLLEESDRHITFVFLGNVESCAIPELIQNIPQPPFKIGRAGYFDRPLFLPEAHPRVAAWHMVWYEGEKEILAFQKHLLESMQKSGLSLHVDRPFLPHLTLCRAPFKRSEWRSHFSSIPFIISNFHLYESLGSLQYKPMWSYFIKSPFDELEHTADIAFLVRGESLSQLYLHAQTALAFQFPSLHLYFTDKREPENLDEIIMALNELVSKVDAEVGCPFKAISYHGELIEKEDVFEWEMIVDV